jgi:hypothetical protein
MNIQEFSHQFAREDGPSAQSPLLRSLRTLSAMQMDWLRDWSRVVKSDWGIWTGFDPGECAERAELG